MQIECQMHADMLLHKWNKNEELDKLLVLSLQIGQTETLQNRITV